MDRDLNSLIEACTSQALRLTKERDFAAAKTINSLLNIVIGQDNAIARLSENYISQRRIIRRLTQLLKGQVRFYDGKRTAQRSRRMQRPL